MGWMSSKSSSTSTPNPVQTAAVQENLNWARFAANQPFKQFAGPWSAGPSQGQITGQANINNSFHVGGAEMGQGATLAREAGTQGTTARNATGRSGAEFMGQFFNPFLSRVAGGMTDEAMRGRTMQIIADEDKALAAGAYGGSRHGVMDAETTRGFHDVLQRNVGDLFARGFDTAAGLGMQDADRFTGVDVGNADRTLRSDMGNSDRRLQAGQVLAGIGDSRHDNFLDSARAQFGAGSTLQALEQERIDRERERFNEWRDFPLRQASIINSAVSGMPNMGGTTTERKDPSLLAQIGAIGSLFF